MAGGQWVEEERNHSHFRDLRIRERACRFVGQLAEHIGAPIPNACQDWANTKAAYRLLSNPRLTEEEILAGHFQATAARGADKNGMILVLHDTSEFSVQRDNPAPVGIIKSLRSGRSYATPHVTTCGVLLHSSLAITEAGLPLGLCAAKFWTRKEFKGTNALKRHVNPTRIPIEEQESVRWIDNLRASTQLLGSPERCLHIGDRESDIYELFCAAQAQKTHFLIRTCVDRRSGPTRLCISEQLEKICPQGQHRFTVPDPDGKPTEAVTEIKFQRLLLHPPEGKQKKYPTLLVTAVHAYETQSPANRERIDWKLLTDLPVDDLTKALMPNPPCEVADIVRAHGRQFIESHRHQLQAGHLRVLQSIENCRTAVLGGHLDACDRCGHRAISYNSCRNRHCPKCQGAARQKWLDRQSSDLLPGPYFHVVLTLPQQLAPVALQNKSAVYGILFRAAAETLLEVAADPKHLGAQLGLLAVLHTWGQALQHHPHLHCVVPGGGLSPDRTQWIPSGGGRFLLPVQVLSRVFRGKFLAFLTAAYRQGKLQFHGRLTSLRQPSAFDQLRRQAYAREWVVYAKRPFAGPEQVLGYLARYTHRVAISNSRILSLDGAHVAFRWKDYACHNKKRKMTITAEEFLRRFLLHVLPKGFVRIRPFGFLASRHRSALLALCRQHLSVFPTIPVSSIVVPATIVPPLCPQCRTGHMQLVERMPSQLRYFRFHDTS